LSWRSEHLLALSTTAAAKSATLSPLAIMMGRDARAAPAPMWRGGMT
jgi:hypothetical protein